MSRAARPLGESCRLRRDHISNAHLTPADQVMRAGPCRSEPARHHLKIEPPLHSEGLKPILSVSPA